MFLVPERRSPKYDLVKDVSSEEELTQHGTISPAIQRHHTILFESRIPWIVLSVGLALLSVYLAIQNASLLNHHSNTLGTYETGFASEISM